MRIDLQIIADQIPNNSRVLDVGCGDGTLLAYLTDKKNINGRGLELSTSKVNEALRNGLAVVQGDLESELSNYTKESFDYVILSQTLQATRNPKSVLETLLHIGNNIVISFPNFGHWKVRLSLLLKGKMPTTPTLPETWYDTENIHLCTILDFISLVDELDVSIKKGYALDRDGSIKTLKALGWAANLVGEQAIFFLEKKR
ncbi:MAG: methionine biosynthesis protein MetW [Alphaproteobacteria bacterium TMED87]|nr:methionine biosynthesis protein MetW [Rhodospirillaceae bacterium]OUV10726.1 MAG: methionine biosynthesis protein MetW [Alphaproteobacteria bacterium TMED87]